MKKDFSLKGGSVRKMLKVNIFELGVFIGDIKGEKQQDVINRFLLIRAHVSSVDKGKRYLKHHAS